MEVILDPTPSIRVETSPPPLTLQAGPIVLIALAVAAAAVAVLLAVAAPDARSMAGTFAALAAALAAAGTLAIRRRRVRFTLEVDARGLTVTRAAGERERLGWDEIESVTLREREALSSGERKGWRRELTLVVPAGRIHAQDFVRVDDEDAFGAFLDAFLFHLATATEERLGRGHEVRGKGWKLSFQGIGSARGLVPLDAIAAAARTGGSVHLWRRGEAAPFLSIPEAGVNARLLLALAQRAAARCKEEELGSEDLGRLLFRKRTGAGMLALAGVVGLGFLAGGLTLLAGDEERWLGAVLAAIAALIVAWAVHASRLRFDCYQAGVVVRRLGGERRLLFRDVAGFYWSATRQYHQGIYTGTSLSLVLEPEGGGRPLRHSGYSRGTDEDFERLRDGLSRVLGARLYERARGGEEPPWGKTARFRRDGVAGFRPRMFGRGEAVLVPYSPELRYSIRNGQFALLDPATGKPAITMACSERNFYPGLLAFGWLCGEAGTRA